MAALVGSLLILGALAVRTDPNLLIVPLGVAFPLIGHALWPHDCRRIFGFTVANAALTGLLLWAATERSVLRIDVSGDSLVASLGSARLTTSIGSHGRQAIGIALAPADERLTIARWAYANLPWLDETALWLTDTLRLAVVDATVHDADGAVLAGPSGTAWQPKSAYASPEVADPVSGWTARHSLRDGYVLSTGGGSWSDYQLLVPIVRPGSTLRVILGDGMSDNVLAVVVAPDHRTFSIQERAEGHDLTVVGGLFAYRRDALAWCQVLVRELSRPWLFGLAMVSLARTFGRPTGSRQPSRLGRGVVTGVFASLTLAVTALIARIVLEGIPHVQDSVTYLFQAQLFALGRLSAPAPPLPEFFEQEFVLVHAGQWFGKYPPGQPLLLALGVRIGAPWLISPIAAAGAVTLTLEAGRRMYGPGTAILAALFMLTSPFFLLMSGSMMSHPAGLFWTALLVVATVDAWQRPGRAAWFLAGLALGMLAITRQLTAVALGTPLLLMLATRLARTPADAPGRSALFSVGALPPLAFLLFFNWQLLGDPLQSPYEKWWDFDRIGFGATVGMHGGHDVANGLANTWANLSELSRHLFGWPAYLTLAPCAVPFLVGSRKLWDWVLAACVAGLVVGYVAYWADGIMYGPRYYYEAIGALALLTARGFAILANGLPHTSIPGGAAMAPRPSWTAGPAVGALVAALIGVNVVGYLPPMIGAHYAYNGVSRTALDTLERAQVGRALVFVSQTWPDWQPYGSVFPANGPLLDGDVVYARDLGSSQNARLMASYPDRRAFRLEGPELSEVGR